MLRPRQAGDGLAEQCAQLPVLLGGQVDAEAAANGLAVHRPGARQRDAADGGEHGEAGPPVDLGGLALGQPSCGQLVHDPADLVPADLRLMRVVMPCDSR